MMAVTAAILWHRSGGSHQLSMMRDGDGLWLVANTPGVRALVRLDDPMLPSDTRAAFRSIAYVMGIEKGGTDGD
jgi:hypothetical protein